MSARSRNPRPVTAATPLRASTAGTGPFVREAEQLPGPHCGCGGYDVAQTVLIVPLEDLTCVGVDQVAAVYESELSTGGLYASRSSPCRSVSNAARRRPDAASLM